MVTSSLSDELTDQDAVTCRLKDPDKSDLHFLSQLSLALKVRIVPYIRARYKFPGVRSQYAADLYEIWLTEKKRPFIAVHIV